MIRKKRSHWRLKLLRWHRRVGVVLGIFLVWMTLSGILLNHDHDLGLDQKTLASSFWLHWYGIGGQQPLMLGNRELRLVENGLWLERQNLGTCPALLGMVQVNDLVVVACPEHVLLLTPSGELIDQTDQARGLSLHINALAVADDQVYLQSGNKVYHLNIDDLSTIENDRQITALSWQEPRTAGATITWERWLLDAHSGRLFGKSGPWLVDILAVAVALLVLSGWLLAKKRHHLP